MKNITLVPFGGLCNRLYSIASAVSYISSHPGDTVKVFWYDSKVCRSRFSDLFLNPVGNSSLMVEELQLSRIKDVPASKYNLFIPFFIRQFCYSLQFSDRNEPEAFEEMSKGHKRVYVCHCNNFWAETNPVKRMSELFVPTKQIQEEIDSICSVYSKRRCVGLHIRRTDNERSIRQSPLSAFESHIEQELESDPDTIFYLATDDAEVKSYLRNKFNDHILSPDFELNRDSYNGMKCAVIDLFCLGKTEKIYGSFASTYSTFASQLYEIPIII